jgi:MFS family permease
VIDRRLRNTALLVAGCFFMEILDATIVVTAIPQMSRSLHVPTSSTALVITAYLLTLAVLVPLSGWMTARFGARRVFLSAIALFTAASLGCALSTSLAMLVVLRIVQGAGGAMMVPVGRLVVLGPAPKSQLMRLMSYIVWPGLLAPVLAPLAGGLITTYASWQWMFDQRAAGGSGLRRRVAADRRHGHRVAPAAGSARRAAHVHGARRRDLRR